MVQAFDDRSLRRIHALLDAVALATDQRECKGHDRHDTQLLISRPATYPSATGGRKQGRTARTRPEAEWISAIQWLPAADQEASACSIGPALYIEDCCESAIPSTIATIVGTINYGDQLWVIAGTHFDPAHALDVIVDSGNWRMVAREGLATDHGNNYVVRLPSMTSQASSAWPVF